jgi:hypothetical protein
MAIIAGGEGTLRTGSMRWEARRVDRPKGAWRVCGDAGERQGKGSPASPGVVARRTAPKIDRKRNLPDGRAGCGAGGGTAHLVCERRGPKCGGGEGVHVFAMGIVASVDGGHLVYEHVAGHQPLAHAADAVAFNDAVLLKGEAGWAGTRGGGAGEEQVRRGTSNGGKRQEGEGGRAQAGLQEEPEC